MIFVVFFWFLFGLIICIFLGLYTALLITHLSVKRIKYSMHRVSGYSAYLAAVVNKPCTCVITAQLTCEAAQYVVC